MTSLGGDIHKYFIIVDFKIFTTPKRWFVAPKSTTEVGTSQVVP